jgi:glyoxylase-like metal-dependent hydrolase (beta-lactamase superfamily II)
MTAITETKRPDIQAFFDNATNTVTYLVTDPATKRAAIIDPVLDFDPATGKADVAGVRRVLDAAHEAGAQVEWVLETHAHADHLTAAPYVKAITGAKIGIGEHIRKVQTIFRPVFNIEVSGDGAEFDHLFADGERFRIGDLEAEVIHTPGHTPACVTYRIADAVFVGDTLFMPDYGTARADFPGGDARTLYRSIRRLLALPDQTRVFLCHDYLPDGRSDYVWETTIGEERRANKHVHEGVGEDEFVSMREARDATLPAPRLLLPSIQTNIRAGRFETAEANGVSYLKIPLRLTEEATKAA